jgi:hypothetical protein
MSGGQFGGLGFESPVGHGFSLADSLDGGTKVVCRRLTSRLWSFSYHDSGLTTNIFFPKLPVCLNISRGLFIKETLFSKTN